MKNVFYFLFISKLALLTLYCVFHTTLSSNSIFVIRSLEREIKQKTEELSLLEKDVAKLNNRISLISDPDHLNLDFLDEEARKKLGFKSKNETKASR